MKNRLSKLITAILLVIVALSCCFLLGCNNGESKTYTHEQIVSKYSPTVVSITAGSKAGTGIILKSGDGQTIIATCYHLTGYDATQVDFVYNGKTYEGETIGYDKPFDLAFFKISEQLSDSKINFLSGENVFSASQKPIMGKQVTAIGNAFGDGISAFDGIVSLPETIELVEGYYKPLVRVTSPINAGCSGCPVFDNDGKLIGMGQGIKQNGEGASYILPAEIVIKMANFATSNPKNDDIERADLAFSKVDGNLIVKVDGVEYIYSDGKIISASQTSESVASLVAFALENLEKKN